MATTGMHKYTVAEGVNLQLGQNGFDVLSSEATVTGNWVAIYNSSADTCQIDATSAIGDSLTNFELLSGDVIYGNFTAITVDTASKFVSSITQDVAFWKGAILSADEVYNLFTRVSDPSQTQGKYLKAWWTLNAKSATGSNNVLDEMGTHHGTTSGLADSDFDTADEPSPTGV